MAAISPGSSGPGPVLDAHVRLGKFAKVARKGFTADFCSAHLVADTDLTLADIAGKYGISVDAVYKFKSNDAPSHIYRYQLFLGSPSELLSALDSHVELKAFLPPFLRRNSLLWLKS